MDDDEELPRYYIVRWFSDPGARGKWASCNMVVNAYFRADFMMNFHLLLPEMMADGIDVLIYAGDVLLLLVTN